MKKSKSRKSNKKSFSRKKTISNKRRSRKNTHLKIMRGGATKCDSILRMFAECEEDIVDSAPTTITYKDTRGDYVSFEKKVVDEKIKYEVKDVDIISVVFSINNKRSRHHGKGDIIGLLKALKLHCKKILNSDDSDGRSKSIVDNIMTSLTRNEPESKNHPHLVLIFILIRMKIQLHAKFTFTISFDFSESDKQKPIYTKRRLYMYIENFLMKLPHFIVDDYFNHNYDYNIKNASVKRGKFSYKIELSPTTE